MKNTIPAVMLSNRAAVPKRTRKLQPRPVCEAELGPLRMYCLPIAAKDRKLGRAVLIGNTLCSPRRRDRTPSFQEPFTVRHHLRSACRKVVFATTRQMLRVALM